MYTEAPSQTQLAVRLEVDARALNAAVGERNALLAESPGMPKLTDPPFTALGPVRSVFVHNEGGLAVDSCHRVLGAGDRPIPGLYVAGATGQGGLLLKGQDTISRGFVSGRRAGRFAAERVIESPP